MLEEKYRATRNTLTRTVVAGDLKGTSRLKLPKREIGDAPLSHLWWQHILRGATPDVERAGTVHAIDFFCGTGGLSLGASKAIEAVAMHHALLAAVDVDGDALGVYRRNFRPQVTLGVNVASIVDFHVYGRGGKASFAYPPEIMDERLAAFMGKTDLVLAGPPCQGHSNLNNHTRRSDPRNVLYVCVAAATVALKARAIVMENVPDVLNDKTDVVGAACKLLADAGYAVSTHVLSAADLGCAQTRKRHFLVGTLRPHIPLAESAVTLAQPAMTLREVIGDLEFTAGGGFMDEVSLLSAENQVRIDFLFDNDLYDLPNEVRPDCHKSGHTYPSVYGRLDWNKPSQTITTGFMTMGRGRYIHPSQRRVITPREAARIQGFPDTFVFAGNGETPSRKLLAKWIGDAVPTQLGYAAVLTALTGF